jgi:hypothetical protein
LDVLLAVSLAASPIVLPADPANEPGQIFVLQDYRWIPVIVRRTPTLVSCSFDVINGTPTVHAELVSEHDFSLFSRHRDYETLASTDTGRKGSFQSMIETPGRYRVLIVNDRGAPPAAVSLIVRSEVDPPNVTVFTGASPRRKLVVILTSLTVFFGTVLFTGGKLVRAFRNRT